MVTILGGVSRTTGPHSTPTSQTAPTASCKPSHSTLLVRHRSRRGPQVVLLVEDLLLEMGLSFLVHQPDVAPEVSVPGRTRARRVHRATAGAIAFHVDPWKMVPLPVLGVLPAGTAWVCKDQGADRVSGVKAIPRDVLGLGGWISALCPVHHPPLGVGVTICLLQAQQLSPLADASWHGGSRS